MARLGQGSYKMSMEYPMVPESKKSAQRIWGKVRKKQKFEQAPNSQIADNIIVADYKPLDKIGNLDSVTTK